MILIPFFAFAENLYSGQKKNLNFPEEFKPDKITDFTLFLINKDENYRALVELRRIRSYYPDYFTPLQYFVTEKYLLFRGKRYDVLQNVDYPQKNSPSYLIGNIFNLDSKIYTADYANANKFLKLLKATEISPYNTFFSKRYFVTKILSGQKEFSVDEKRIYKQLNSEKYRELLSYSTGRIETQKNPYLALSAGLFPGMGYVYAGEKQTGIVAFFAVSITSILTYFAFNTDNRGIGIFTGAVCTFFYTGSILGGYLSTKKYNKTITSGLRDYLVDDLDFRTDRETLYNKYGISHARRK